MNLIYIAKTISFLTVFGYGLLLTCVPNKFLGNFIYKTNLWDEFKPKEDSASKHVLDHLLSGLGLTWIAWSSMYFMDVQDENTFVIVNIIIWAMFSALDMQIRKKGLYSPIASKINILMVNMILATYIACLPNI